MVPARPISSNTAGPLRAGSLRTYKSDISPASGHCQPLTLLLRPAVPAAMAHGGSLSPLHAGDPGGTAIPGLPPFRLLTSGRTQDWPSDPSIPLSSWNRTPFRTHQLWFPVRKHLSGGEERFIRHLKTRVSPYTRTPPPPPCPRKWLLLCFSWFLKIANYSRHFPAGQQVGRKKLSCLVTWWQFHKPEYI